MRRRMQTGPGELGGASRESAARGVEYPMKLVSA